MTVIGGVTPGSNHLLVFVDGELIELCEAASEEFHWAVRVKRRRNKQVVGSGRGFAVRELVQGTVEIKLRSDAPMEIRALYPGVERIAA